MHSASKRRHWKSHDYFNKWLYKSFNGTAVPSPFPIPEIKMKVYTYEKKNSCFSWSQAESFCAWIFFKKVAINVLLFILDSEREIVRKRFVLK